MKSPQEIFELLKNKFGESILAQNAAALFEYTIDVEPKQLFEVCKFLYLHDELQFDNLVVLSAVDDANGVKTALADGGSEIVGGTLSVFYHLDSLVHKHSVVLRVSMPREKAEVPSVTSIWLHADWEEREAYDMMGIIFLNHPDLQRILMPYDWDAGYPLRKDYRNPEFYQGMKIPY